MAETIPQFYKRIQRCDPKLDATYSKGKEYFNIFSRQCNFGTVQFSYRDFYEVTLIMGIGKLFIYKLKFMLIISVANIGILLQQLFYIRHILN